MNKRGTSGAAAALFLAFTGTSLGQDGPPEMAPIETSSAEFQASREAAFNSLDEEFVLNLDFGSFAAAAAPFNITVNEPLTNFGLGVMNQAYDVVLQPGHYKRASGRTGTAYRENGKDVLTEQTLVAYVISVIAKKLAEAGYSVLVIPADNYKRPLKPAIFLSIHADGTGTGCSPKGPSMGYGEDSDMLGMHLLGFSLAAAMGYKPADWHKDSFTANLREYYAFKHMTSGIFEGVLELGELTCKNKASLLATNANMIGNNLAASLAHSLNLHGIVP